MKILTIGLFVAALVASGCEPPSREYPIQRGPMLIYWEGRNFGSYEAVFRLAGKCYYKSIRSGGFAADSETIIEIDCDEAESYR